MSKRTGFGIALAFSLLAGGIYGQDKVGAAKQSVQSGAAASTTPTDAPSGITKAQADAILEELRQIRLLLQNQQAQAPRVAAVQPAAPDKVKMTVGSGWHSLGRDDAPVTMVEFTDYQCPFCRRFESDSFAQLKKDYIDTGKVRFVIRDLPMDFHTNAPRAAIAAHCAGEQSKFWEMHDTMMHDTANDLSLNALLKFAQQNSLNMPAFVACISEPTFSAAMQKDAADAGAMGISGTPSFVIGKTASKEIDGVRIVGAVPYSVFASAITSSLAR